MFVKFKQSERDAKTVHAWQHPASFEAQLLPPPEGSNPTAEFLQALYTLASVIVTLPAYLALSVALAVAFYIRCAGVLLTIK